MFFGKSSFSAEHIDVYKLMRDPYRKTAQDRPFHAISFRIYGNAAYEISGETVRTETEDILFVPAHLKYTKDTQAELFYVIHFDCEENIGNKLKRFSPSKPELFRKIFDRIYRVQTEKGTAYEHEVKHLFYELIAMIEVEWGREEKKEIECQIDQAIKYIHEGFMRADLSIAALAKSVNMSETYFRRQFRSATGMSPKEYVSDLRLRLALELLRSGYYSVAEVSQRCGFSSAYYFSAYMKRETGKSPHELRFHTDAVSMVKTKKEETEK